MKCRAANAPIQGFAAAFVIAIRAGCAAFVAFVALAAFVASSAFAGGIDPAAFANDSQRRNYETAIRGLRCMECQNQTVAESDARLAKDMRAVARKMALDGKNADDIVGYITARYGDFAVYRPPFDGRTAVLWLAPFVLALAALCFLPVIWRRHRQPSAERAE